MASCKPTAKTTAADKQATSKFVSEKYGFSFSYPVGMEEVRKDLPNKWALADKDKNTILFTINKAKTNNLMALGRVQALRDLYKDNSTGENVEKVKEIFNIVKLDSFNNQTWYTYGIKFSDKKVNSLISGTVCLDNEITMVMVSNYDSFEDLRQKYMLILNSFGCQT